MTFYGSPTIKTPDIDEIKK